MQLHNWFVGMQHRHLINEGLASIALPTTLRFSQESSSLDKKLAPQVQWMRNRGLNIRLKESERPSVERKLPLPGTVIYFSCDA
jgi:hypothetical protein